MHDMTRKAVRVLAALLALACAGAEAQSRGCITSRDGRLVCPPPDGRCLYDRLGEVVCSTAGGGITLDRFADPVCGPGHCTADYLGQVFCSSAPRGAVGIDRYGKVACSVGCVPAKADACIRPKPAD